MQCIQCSKEFEGRTGAKYCSDKCRMKYVRSVRDKAEATIKPNKANTETGEVVRDSVKSNTEEVKANKTPATKYKSNGHEDWCNCLMCQGKPSLRSWHYGKPATS